MISETLNIVYNEGTRKLQIYSDYYDVFKTITLHPGTDMIFTGWADFYNTNGSSNKTSLKVIVHNWRGNIFDLKKQYMFGAHGENLNHQIQVDDINEAWLIDVKTWRG